MPIPRRTAISVVLRIIPPTAGLTRYMKKGTPVYKARHIIERQQRKQLAVERDFELEKEIASWIAKQPEPSG